MSDGNHELENHEYDGIRELDNQLPNWWLATLWGTVIFALGYVVYYHVGPGRSIEREFAEDQAEIALKQVVAKARDPGPSEEKLAAIVVNPDRRAEGRQVYALRCVACHGAAGEGGIGPNLTDDFWIHGGKLAQMAQVIRKGVLDKGMPAWDGMMTSDEIASVLAAIHAMRGTNPPGAKAAQGNREAP